MKKQIMLLTLCLLAVLVSLSAVSAANITVGTDGYSTIKEAVDNAQDGDTIVISNGTYTGDNNRNINIYRNINITGQSQEGTIIESDHNNRIFYIDDDNTVTISSLTLRDGGGYGGGAIHNDGNLTVNDCTFDSNNVTNYHGGAIWNEGYLTVNRCIFTNNTASYGGAIYQDDGTVNINKCKFINNQAGMGGAIATDNDLLAPTIVNNCIFDSNTASNVGGGYGGAIYSGYEITITGCNFNKNTASYRGGAIYTGEDLTVKYSRFVGNSATDLGQDIYSAYSHLQSATLNWWGSNSGPAEGRIVIMDTNQDDIVPLYTPWLVMNILPADPSTIYTGQTSKITVNVYTDSNGINHGVDAAQFFSGPEVKFTTNLGNVGSKSVTVPWTLGMAFATLRGDEGPGIATVTAADGEIKSTTVTILQAPVIDNPEDPINDSDPTVNAASNTVGMQETGIPIAGLVLAILAVFAGLVIPKRK